MRIQQQCSKTNSEEWDRQECFFEHPELEKINTTYQNKKIYITNINVDLDQIPPLKKENWGRNKTICRKTKDSRKWDVTCLLACKVTVIMRSEAVRSRGSCGSATVRLCTQHRAEMLLLPPTYQLMSTPGEKPARTQRRHAATHPSHTRTQAHTHLHTGTNNQQFTLRDLPLPLRFLLFFCRFGFSFFSPH